MVLPGCHRLLLGVRRGLLLLESRLVSWWSEQVVTCTSELDFAIEGFGALALVLDDCLVRGGGGSCE